MRTYKLGIENRVWRYRGATRGEANSIYREYPQDVFAQEDALIALCVEDLGEVDTLLAGVANRLIAGVMEASGFGTERLKEEAQTWLNSEAGHSESLMMLLFNWTPNQIENLDPPDWVKAACASELFWSLQNGTPPPKQAPPEEPWRPGEKKTVTENAFNVRR